MGSVQLISGFGEGMKTGSETARSDFYNMATNVTIILFIYLLLGQNENMNNDPF